MQEQDTLIINEDAPEIGHRALNSRDIYVNYTEDYTLTNFEHMHLTHEILFVEEGEAEYVINGLKYSLKKHDIFIIGSMDLHRLTVKKEPYVRYGLALTPSYIMDRNNLHVFHSLLCTHAPLQSQLIYNLDEEEFLWYSGLLHKLKKEIGQKMDLYTEAIDAYLMLILTSLYRKMQLTDVEKKTNGVAIIMEKICKHINDHYNETITLESLSERFFCHPCTISREFARHYGRNLNQYLNSTRIAVAVQYLETTDCSVTEIGYCCGYSNVNTFLRRFRSIMGCSPLQYRKRFFQQKKQASDIRADITAEM